MSLLEMLAQQVSGTPVNEISSQIGATPEQTQRAVAVALPALLGGLARNANASPDGARSLANALEQDHDGSLLDNLPGLLGMLGGGQQSGGGLGSLLGAATQMMGGNARAANGDGILEHILGPKRRTVEQSVSQASGLDVSKVARLLPVLAPIVMGMLGKVKRQQNLDPGGLAGMLGQERQQMEQQTPGLGGLMRMLDTDGDGEVMDDVARIGGALSGLFGKR